MRLAVRQRAADADEEQRAVFPGGRLLPLLRREPGELPQQLLGLDERDALGQDRGDVREELVNLLLDGLHRVVDLFDDLLEEAEVALLGTDRALPVPLVHVERMGVVQLLVGADGVHVGVQPVSGGDFVGAELHALPLGERVHHFGPPVAQVADGKRHGALHAVQVVVDARAREHEERGGDAPQPERAGELVGEDFLEVRDGLLHRLGGEFGRIVVGNEKRHVDLLSVRGS